MLEFFGMHRNSILIRIFVDYEEEKKYYVVKDLEVIFISKKMHLWWIRHRGWKNFTKE